MQGLPEPGRLVLIKPLPGKLVPEEGSTTWVPPGGVYRPWSAHFAAMLMAGLDGIKNKIEPREPVDKDLYELAPEEAADIPQVPASLEGALDALEADSEYLQAGNVFTEDLIETWLDYKRSNEVDPMRLRPHPHEFELYYDI